jgi:hypothetical protein
MTIKLPLDLFDAVARAAARDRVNRMDWVIDVLRDCADCPAPGERPRIVDARVEEVWARHADPHYYDHDATSISSTLGAPMDVLIERGRCARTPQAEGAL